MKFSGFLIALSLFSVCGHASPPNSGYFKIKPLHSGLCLDWIIDKQGVRIQQEECADVPTQIFEISDAGNRNYIIHTANQNMCLDVEYESTQVGANIIHWACHGGVNQKFSIQSIANDQFRITSDQSGLCLELIFGLTWPGLPLIQNECSPQNVENQTFVFEPTRSPPRSL